LSALVSGRPVGACFASIAGFLYPAKAENAPAGCCLQDSLPGPLRRGSASITQTCPETELLFARSAASPFKSQTAAAERFRSKTEVLFARSQQVLLAVPGLLLFPVLSDCLGVLFAVTLPVIRVAAAPFPRTVPAHLAVFFVCLQLLLAVFGPPPLLAQRLTANCLLRLVLRGLKSFLTIAATPFSHMARYRIPAKGEEFRN
jgi:hypothetical protein